MVALGVVVAAFPQSLRLEAVAAAVARKISPGVLALIVPAMFYSGVILAAIGVIGRNLAVRWSGRRLAPASLVLLTLTLPLLLVRWERAIAAHTESISSRRLAQAIRRSPERDLAIYAFHCFRTGLPFYLERPVGLVTSGGGEMTSNYIVRTLERRQSMMIVNPPGEPDLIDADGLRASRSAAILVLARNRDVERLSRTVPDMEAIWNDWEYSIWRVPAADAEKHTGQ
jgi:hypothetical protein